MPMKQIYFNIKGFIGFLGGSVVKNMSAKKKTLVWSLGQENPLEKKMANYSSILAWEIQWTEEPGGLQSMQLQRVGHRLSTKEQWQKGFMVLVEYHYILLPKKGMTEDQMVGWHHQLNGNGFRWTPEVADGQGGLVCCGSWGHKESDTTEWLNWTELKGRLYIESTNQLSRKFSHNIYIDKSTEEHSVLRKILS